MKHTLFALPALLRSAIFLAATTAAASPSPAFSVHDDLLAFPQYEILFLEEHVTEAQAQARLFPHEAGASPDNDANDAFPLEHYRLSDYANPVHPHASGGEQEPLKFEYESVVLDGQPYLCSIPQIPKPDPISRDAAGNSSTTTLSKAEQEKELARATDRGWELLSGMQGNCVYFISGWWSYRFCYNDGVRQFHQLPPSRGVPPYPPTEDPGVQGFTLGKYAEGSAVGGGEEKDGFGDEEALHALDLGQSKAKHTTRSPAEVAGKLVHRGETRYLVQNLDGGTKCDLTGKDRKIEVQFHCNPQSADRISLIKETSTCAYLMVIHTPRLCHDVAFQPPQKDHPHPITCSPIVATPDDLATYQTQLSAYKAAISSAAASAAASPAAIIGDIEVGAHKIVPRDFKLEKSAIVGGGKETFLETVASSADGVLSKEELEKRGLDPKIVAELSKMLKGRAEPGQGWKLNVVQTPRGREFSGVVEEVPGEGPQEGDEAKQDAKKEGKKEGDNKKKKKAMKKDEDERDVKAEEGSQEEYFHKDEL